MIAVNHASPVAEGGWTLQCAQPKVLPLKSVLVPGANTQTLFGWKALPDLRVDCRTFFFRKELTEWKMYCSPISGCSQRPAIFAKSF